MTNVEQKQFLDEAGLQKYHDLTVTLFSDDVAKSIKKVIEGENGVLYFYRDKDAQVGDTADFTYTPPVTDLSNQMTKVAGGTENNLVALDAEGNAKDSGISETSLKEYVNQQIAVAGHLNKEVVDAIPDASSAEDNKIYLIKDPESAEGESIYYEEWMKINDQMVKISDTKIDLTDYYKKTEVDGKVQEVSESLSTHTTNTDIHVTTEDKTNWNGAKTTAEEALSKVDAISAIPESTITALFNS